MAKALIIVDYQNDFNPPDGALAVPGGDAIADRLNELAADDRYEVVIATRDWHPPDHESFAEQGGPWPVHCVQGTPGAELHPGLDQSQVDAIVDKGQARDTEGYSAFEADGVNRLVQNSNVGDTYTGSTGVSLLPVPEPNGLALLGAAALGLHSCKRPGRGA